MLTDWTLRPISKNDDELLRKIFLSSWDRALAISPLPAETKDTILNQQFEAQHRSYQFQYPHGNFDFIIVGNQPVGRIYVDRGPEQFVLIDITLISEHRRTGIGSAIINELLDEARSAGKPVVLHVEKWNPEAHSLYHRLGFTDLEDIGSHWKMQWLPLADAN